ncbi:MAG TPA: transketolase C-terminal domain-containing protein [Pyrinomonadaceae bacterium]|nr:transketolase C-terminal domain-containing protein [Pyrinomonadaceae bacterium]
MRDAFSNALVGAARENAKVLLLTGDHGYALFDEFRRVCPDQYINAGIAEQNMVGVAAGLAKAGFHPVVYGLSAFVPVRVLEQIKLDVCYEQLPVTFIGDGAGVVYSSLGTSHQSTEDIAALRAVPHINILSPADRHETLSCMKLAIAADKPVYLRMGKADLGDVHESAVDLVWGDLRQVKTGAGDIAFIATGAMVKTALAVSGDWAESSVWSAPFIKPINEEQIAEICRNHRAVVVLEEHSIYGGLGAAIAEISSARTPTWICRVGIQDRFSEFCGTYDYLMREHRLDSESVAAQINEFLNRVGYQDKTVSFAAEKM